MTYRDLFIKKVNQKEGIKMASRSKGFRSKTRRVLKRRGTRRLTVNEKLKELQIGSKTVLNLEPSIQRGMPHPRYQGAVGTIIAKRGRAYVVEIHDGHKPKHLVAFPEHLHTLKTAA